jgi:VanZ family protein
MALLFVLSSQPGLRIHPDAEVDRPLRIVAHAASYAVLGALLVFALAGTRRPTLGTILGAVLVAVLFALSDEFHQSLVPGRTGRLDDVVVDAVGATLGVLAMAGLGRLRPSFRPSRPGDDAPTPRG